MSLLRGKRWNVWVSRKFLGWGTRHHYYDGANCALVLGFLVINWYPDDCDKCWPPEYDKQFEE